MDDELEDKIFYQTYVSHMKILSKFAVGVSSINSPIAYLWKLCRLYLLRPEVVFCSLILLVFLFYLQAFDAWSRHLIDRIQTTLGRQRGGRINAADSSGTGDKQCWKELRQQSSAFAVQGRRPRMEDRFVLDENINNNTGISFFAVFDGHGGEFAADYAKEILVKNIYNRLIEVTKVLRAQQKHLQQHQQQQQHLSPANAADIDAVNFIEYDTSPYLKRRASLRLPGEQDVSQNKENKDSIARRRDSFRKAHTASSDDCSTLPKNMQQKEVDVFTSKLNSLMRGTNSAAKDAFNNNNINDNNPSAIGGEGGSGTNSTASQTHFDPHCYIENGKINFGKFITDEVLSADFKLVEMAKRTTNIAGTTALIAIIQGSQLTVANVGDSRGVMCDSRGIAIPLSFDHKPQQVRERKRIHDAGGFIAFRGVWRVAGILATSRALGDYPLKDKQLVIANPDILTFDLNDHKPSFLVLASDGLWDTFSNEEACSYIKEHLNEPDFGAKSLAMQSYYRGSVDNITVLVIVFRNGVYRIANATISNSPTSPASTAPLDASAVKSAGTANAAKAAHAAVVSAAVKRSNSNVSNK